MKPKKINTAQEDLFRTRLSNQLSPKDTLFILRSQIDWAGLESDLAFEYGSPSSTISQACSAHG